MYKNGQRVKVTEAYGKNKWMTNKIGILKDLKGGPVNNPEIIIKDDKGKEHTIYGHECWWGNVMSDEEGAKATKRKKEFLAKMFG